MRIQRREERCVSIRASFLDHLCDRHGRTSSRSLFQKFHSICQLTLESVSSVVIAWPFVQLRSSYLLSVGEIDFFRDNHKPSQNDGHLAATLLSFFLQRIEPRNLAPRELIVIINKIVRGLCPFAVLMNGLQLLALQRVSSSSRRSSSETRGVPIRTAVRPTSFIFVSIVENDCPTDYEN